MAKSGYKEPVGLIIEMTDEVGTQLTCSALEWLDMPRHELSELIATYCKYAIPTFQAIVTEAADIGASGQLAITFEPSGFEVFLEQFSEERAVA